jgi:hypothetical protein
LKTKVGRQLKVAIALGLTGVIALGPLSVAQADPPANQYAQLVGLGSDTTMDVMDGIATALGRSGNSTSLWKLGSYKAIGSATVQTRSTGTPIPRFNGSSAGRDALYISMGQIAQGSPQVGSSAGPTVTTNDLFGKIDFARSSSGPGSSTRADGVVTYIPFAIDALTYATSPNSKIPAGIKLGTDDDNSEVSLMNIYQGHITRVITANDANGEFIKLVGPAYELEAGEFSSPIKAYTPQPGSGTRSFWNSTVKITDANVGSDKFVKDTYGDGLPVQEHDGSAVGNDPFALVGFSIAQYVAQTNQVAPDRRNGAVINSMAVSGTEQVPTTGTGTNLVTNPNWTAIKRTVYNIVPTALANATGSNLIKTMFVGENSLVCQQKTVIQRYGFGLLVYPGTPAGASGTTEGGHATQCGNITALNRVGAPSTSSVTLGTPTLASDSLSATVRATVTSNANRGGVVKIYNGSVSNSNLVGTGTIANGQTSVLVTVKRSDNKGGQLSLVARFTPTLTGVAEPTSSGTTTVTVKGMTTMTATARTVRASVIPAVSVTARDGAASSTSYVAGTVTVVAINHDNRRAFFATGTLANRASNSVSFTERFPAGRYSLWVIYPGSTLNVPKTITSTLVVNP